MTGISMEADADGGGGGFGVWVLVVLIVLLCIGAYFYFDVPGSERANAWCKDHGYKGNAVLSKDACYFNNCTTNQANNTVCELGGFVKIPSKERGNVS